MFCFSRKGCVWRDVVAVSRLLFVYVCARPPNRRARAAQKCVQPQIHTRATATPPRYRCKCMRVYCMMYLVGVIHRRLEVRGVEEVPPAVLAQVGRVLAALRLVVFNKGVWWLNGRGQWSKNEGRTRRQQRQGAHNQTKAQPPLDGGSHISTRQQRGSRTIQPQAHVCTYVAGLAVADADGVGLLVELKGGRVRLHVVQDAHLPVGFRSGWGRGCGAVCQRCGSWRSSGWLVHQAAIPDVLASHNNGRREDTQKTQARTARRSGSSPGT